MDYGVLAALQCLKCLFDNMLSGLGKNLHGHIIGNKLPLDKRAAEFVFRIACRGKAYLYFLEAYLNQISEKFQFFLQAHRNDKRLISVAQIHTAPDRRLFDILLCRPVKAGERRHKIAAFIFVCICHNFIPFIYSYFRIFKKDFISIKRDEVLKLHGTTLIGIKCPLRHIIQCASR